jgi:N-acetylglucosaminyldiphosphoundecaprenol N-acetyl-beta-D-mannosaminyltransferase
VSIDLRERPTSALRPRASHSSRRLFGFDFVNAHDVTATVDQILGVQPLDGLLPLVVTPNVDYIVQLRQPQHAELAATLRRARYVLPDGQPIVWTSRLTGEPLAARLPGSSMFPLVWGKVAAERRPAMIVASSYRTAEQLRREHPQVGVVVPPHFGVDDDAQLARVVEECRRVIAEVKPEFVFLGISFPKQQHIALALVEALEATGEPLPLFLTLGGSFEMYLGQVPRAPGWMQSVGLEWFFRFLMEPRRLFRRYFVTDMQFAALFVKELVRSRSSWRRVRRRLV